MDVVPECIAHTGTLAVHQRWLGWDTDEHFLKFQLLPIYFSAH